jgi:maleylacetoacetate isomerase
MLFYDYFRSSACYRVRIALALKGLTPERAFVHLRRDEQHAEAYARINPQRLVPALVDGDVPLTQSLAIIEYLDETHPQPPLLPGDAFARARVRALALAVVCEIHPLNNMRVLSHLTGPLGLSEQHKTAWYQHWIAVGFTALEQMLASGPSGPFCHGDTPTVADICLVPQVTNAHRFACDMAPYPAISRIAAHCATVPAFASALPSQQPDAE